MPGTRFFIWNTGTPHLSPNTPGNRKTNPITALHTLYNRLLYCRIRYSIILHYPPNALTVRILQNHSKIKQSKYFDRRRPPASNHKYGNRRTAFLFLPAQLRRIIQKNKELQKHALAIRPTAQRDVNINNSARLRTHSALIANTFSLIDPCSPLPDRAALRCLQSSNARSCILSETPAAIDIIAKLVLPHLHISTYR